MFEAGWSGTDARQRATLAVEGQEGALVEDVVHIERHVPAIAPETDAEIDQIVGQQLAPVAHQAKVLGRSKPALTSAQLLHGLPGWRRAGTARLGV